MKTSPAGISLIKRFEGCRLYAYQDIVGIWTIGYGDTLNVSEGMTITLDEAERRLDDRLEREFEPGVMAAIGDVPTTQNQFDAMVSLAWNVGVGRPRTDPHGPAGFKGSSVARHHKLGDYAAAADAFLLWNHAGGRVNDALRKRRSEERALYLTGAAAPAKPAARVRTDDQDMLAAWVELGQRILVAAGVDPGPIDGIMGPRTQAAIKALQKRNGVGSTTDPGAE